ncbi:MAG: response regulator [Candidatus Omnitrophota bacterium]|nr:MAG: response regulator [Candidatus Omnitrophota bacterium]
MRQKKSITILLVEDDEGHAILVKENLRAARIINELYHVKDGQEALDFLFHRGSYTDTKVSPKPGLILLDIKLPKLDGYAVLERVKQDEQLKVIPVIMLTSTEDQMEINRSYDLGANGYVIKPVEYHAFQERIKNLGLFLDIVALPD